MGILSSCSRVSTTVSLHLDYNETQGEKARWELHNDAACCFQQILEAAPCKTAIGRPLTSHLVIQVR